MDSKDIKRILVVKLRHHGDVLLTSPVFSVIKDRFPSAKIDAYIYAETLPMLEGHPAINEFILYDKQMKKKGVLKRVFYELTLLWRIFRAKYDLVMNLTEGDRGALVAKIARAKIRIGFDPENSGMLGKKGCYTHIVRICHQTRHTVERHLDVVRCLGISPSFCQRELYFHIPNEAKTRMIKLLSEKGIMIEQGFILIHPVSRWLFKCLPEKTVADVILKLSSRGEQIVLTASSDPLEIKMNETILQLSQGASTCHLGGMVSLKELGALITLSKLLICVDSVPMHIASALKAPVLAIFGPTSEKTWAPWRNPYAKVLVQDYSCRPCYMPGCGGSKKSDCLETMSSLKIYEEAKSLLEMELCLKI